MVIRLILFGKKNNMKGDGHSFFSDSLDVLVMSLDHAPIHADQIPVLFHLAESIQCFLCSDTTLSDPPSSYKMKMLQVYAT